MLKRLFNNGFFKENSIGILLARQDILSRYRRSAIGPFWLTISMGVMIATIGTVFSRILNVSNEKFLPFLTISIILWGFISNNISEGCAAFIDSQTMIKQLPIPLIVYILRVLYRNILILFHNFLIFPLVMLIANTKLTLISLLSILGFFIVLLSLSWMMLLLSMLSARYRDLPQIILSMLQIIFYLTPIVWMPDLIHGRFGALFLNFNPFYHMLELIRAPLLGYVPSMSNWVVVILVAFIGWIIALFLYTRFHKKISYWV